MKRNAVWWIAGAVVVWWVFFRKPQPGAAAILKPSPGPASTQGLTPDQLAWIKSHPGQQPL